MTDRDDCLWQPSPARVAAAQMTRFRAWLLAHRGLDFPDYESLWRWSVEKQEDFWAAVWDFCEVKARRGYTRVKTDAQMPFTRWFEGCELNFVEQVFAHRARPGPAIVFDSEAGGRGEISWPELERQVAALGHTLRLLGVRPGDRVVGYLPNIPQAVVAFLAAASIGAIWSIVAPDMGPLSVLDRFKQIAPKVLIACDGYRFAGKSYDRRQTLGSIVAQLPTLAHLILVEHLLPRATTAPGIEREFLPWSAATAGCFPLDIASLPGDHPLWILYSSGTTGLPKGIVHGHAGILVRSLMSLRLHSDLSGGERVFWISSTSWMVWNAHVSALLVGATIVLFDGSPTGPTEPADWTFLWRLVERVRVNSFGAGAAFYHANIKASVVPRECADLSSLQTVTSTGSPLSNEGYRWLIDSVKKDLWINSASGGTDICGAFVGGAPILPVYIGEMQCRLLGAAVEAFGDTGTPLYDEVGELVCTRPLPSMPLYFWGDPDGKRYWDSYFGTFTGPQGESIWCHGDWVRLIRRPHAIGAVIYGRSDATINRHGVRMGTAELYRAVEAFTEIVDSMVVDLEYLGKPSYMALFVVLRPGIDLSPDLDQRLRQSIRAALSARHVPNEILAVPDIPRTLTGKKLELPIKKLLLGHPLEKVVNADALANPSSLSWYVEFAARRDRLRPESG